MKKQTQLHAASDASSPCVIQEAPVPKTRIARPLLIATVATAASLLAVGAPRALALRAGWESGSVEVLDGLGRVVVGLLGLLWLRLSGRWQLGGASRGWRPSGLRSAWVLCTAAVLPLYGLFFTAWPASDIATWACLVFGTVVYETFVFRGVVFTGLATAWADNEHGVRNAAIASSLLFGIAHINPVAIVGATAVALAFTHLQVSTRSLYPAMVLHFVYDIATHFPLDASGASVESEGALGALLSAPMLLAAAALALLGLHRDRSQLAELMSDDSPDSRERYALAKFFWPLTLPSLRSLTR